jgi:hypothetical protein
MPQPAAWILSAVVFPLLVAAGLADWACHRATRISVTSGLRENLLHWVMFVELGVGTLAVALLEINAGVLLLVLAVFLVHEATVWVDLRFTQPRRVIPPIEQMVHSLQEILPLAALLLLAALAWEQALAIVGAGTEQPDYALRWKDVPLPLPLLLGGAIAVGLLNVLPLAQETAACVRARRRIAA